MDDDAVARLLRAALPGEDVTVLPPRLGSENRHARAGSLFVKVYRDAGKCATERLALTALGARYDWPVLPVAGGETWLAFPWLDLAPVTSLREWGTRLAEVHATPVPGGLERTGRALDRVESRLARLHDLPDVHALALRVWSPEIAVEAAAHHTPEVFLTNDFRLANSAVRPDGVVALIDLERAGAGDPHWDLGKVWDDDLRAPEDRATFLDGYRSIVGDTGWPHQPTLWVTRYVAALAAIPYALRVDDPGFYRHALAMLERLGDER